MALDFKMLNFLSLFAVILLVGCIPSNNKEPRIVETKIGEQAFRIPENYLQKPYPKSIDRRAALLVMYPDFKPPKKSSRALFKQGEWYKNISIHFGEYDTNKTIKDTIDRHVEVDNLTKVVGDYHGLTYRTYPEDSKIKRSELWIEGDNVGRIRCSLEGKRSDGEPLLPQCQYTFIWHRQFIRLHIDKRLLPNWKTIKDNVVRLLEEFEVTDQPITTSAQGE